MSSPCVKCGSRRMSPLMREKMITDAHRALVTWREAPCPADDPATEHAIEVALCSAYTDLCFVEADQRGLCMGCGSKERNECNTPR